MKHKNIFFIYFNVYSLKKINKKKNENKNGNN